MDAPRWWQWPTILSLDAPAVCVMWQAALARVAGVQLQWPHVAVLGFTVWLAYAADRWIEGWHLHWSDIRTQRHHFYQRHRWPVAVVWLLVLVADLVIAFTQLAWRDIGAGALLTTLVLLYLLSHQLVHRQRRWRLPKELCVAALLTGGVCVFLVTAATLGVIASSASLFALLCFSNCALISSWEREVDLAHGQTSLALAAAGHGWAIPQLPWLIVVLAGAAYVGHTGPVRMVAACALLSAVLLGLVDRLERRTGWKAARVLSDVALMTPALFLPWGP
jgi:hypothetical protein